jgi:DNA polymerase-3 subunit epsilon
MDMKLQSDRSVHFFIALAVILSAPVVAFVITWLLFDRTEQEQILRLVATHPSSIISALFVLLGALAFAVHWVFRHHIEPLKKLAEDVELISTTNAAHRVSAANTGDVGRLGRAINALGEEIQGTRENFDQKVYQARSDLEREKNTLAALIHELTDGVLVCTLEGQIVLYNKRARQILSPDDARPESGPPEKAQLGLGRSIFGLLDRSVIAHAVEDLGQKLSTGSLDAVSQLIAAGGTDRILRVQAVPVLDQHNAMTGFVLILNDITERLDQDLRHDAALLSLLGEIRRSLANVRAASESLQDYPGMGEDQRQRFVAIVSQEARGMSATLDSSAVTMESRGQWELEPVLCSHLLSLLKRRAEQTLDVTLAVEDTGEQFWVNVNTFSILQSLQFLIQEMKSSTGTITYSSRAGRNGTLISVDIVWKGALLPAATLRSWESRPLVVQGRGIPLTLLDVLQQHNAELWSQAEDEGGLAYLRLIIPSANEETGSRGWRVPVSVASRPEFYDFDLFQRRTRDVGMDDRLLTDLAYTAFDTETTGLQPSAGDEIISIGAVRIVNGRLLRDERFDQLVNPLRPLPPESIRVHGITPESLEGQPMIGTVLPAFRQFAEGTVLVAHNAAFDLRFFQMKEASTGVRLTNPVLDTLLLSAIVHPNQDGHNLEEIAARFGISIIGRHTALGDALLTGEVFIRLIPLLAQRGVRTLREADMASQRTYFARITY